MKLSEAICLSIGVVIEDRTTFLQVHGDCARGCAIGTAIYSMGERSNESMGVGKCYQFWPWTQRRVANPDRVLREVIEWAYGPNTTIAETISLLHCHKWSRERIAAWVEELEAVYDPMPTAPVTEEVCHAAQ